MDTADKIKVMQAFMAGKGIEEYSKEYKSVPPLLYGPNGAPNEPPWNWQHFDYKIKPEPREWFVVMTKDGTPLSSYLHHSDAVSHALANSLNIIKVREVLD